MEKNNKQLHFSDENCFTDLFVDDDGHFCISNTVEKFHIVSQGRLNGRLKELVSDIVNEIKSSDIRRKMSTFYIIRTENRFLTFFSLSGFSKENANRDINEKVSIKSEKIKNVTFIPMAEEQDEKAIEPNNENCRIARNDLFKRFLIAVTSNLNKIEEFNKLKEKFELNEDNITHVKFLYESMKKGGEFDLIYNEYKNDKGEECSTKIELLLELFYIYQEFNFIETINNSGFASIDIFKVEDKEIKYRYDNIKYFPQLEMYYKSFKNPELYIESLKNLSDALKDFNDLSISNKLAHCSETNLLYFLYEHPDILSVPGEHYIFSLKLEDSEKGLISDLCEVCNVNFTEHFKNLLSEQRLSANFNLKATIPVIDINDDPANSNSDEEWENKVEDYHQKNAEYFHASDEGIDVYYEPYKNVPDTKEKKELLKKVTDIMRGIGTIQYKYEKSNESIISQQEKKYGFQNNEGISVSASELLEVISPFFNNNPQNNNTNQENVASDEADETKKATDENNLPLDDTEQENQDSNQKEDEEVTTVKCRTS